MAIPPSLHCLRGCYHRPWSAWTQLISWGMPSSPAADARLTRHCKYMRISKGGGGHLQYMRIRIGWWHQGGGLCTSNDWWDKRWDVHLPRSKWPDRSSRCNLQMVLMLNFANHKQTTRFSCWYPLSSHSHNLRNSAIKNQKSNLCNFLHESHYLRMDVGR